MQQILVVEDEPTIADALERGLEAEGYLVDVADNGHDGLEMARTNNYAVLLLDLMLPGLNGYQVCRTLRAEQNLTPILILTAKDGDHDHAEGLDTGADDYLTKPFAFTVLTAHIRALIRRGGYERPSALSVDDLIVDPTSRRCHRGQVEIELTPREFAIVHHLLDRMGTVCQKEDIIADIWGDDFAGDPNIVEVYIGRVRRKIDNPFDRSNVQTVRGSGYRIVPDPKAGLP